ncbi:hypothetical protein R1sor_026005 [Riccia sorocarpa]|uniref:NB-ARC domain-containing protein n=1 Tax=Riccia sorocarpa TaxID=122646 RepID=A0ABD3GCZ1_9MARC
MAASSSRDSVSDSAIIPYRGWKELSDSVFEVFRPSEGYFNLEIVFLHGFGSKSDTDLYYETWMKADRSANWLDTWLAESFPRARILSVTYDSSLITSSCTGRVDMYLLGESLAQSLVDLAEVGRTCPVVLVGHCLGGMVLKSIALHSQSLANEERTGGSLSRPYDTFLRNLKGAFFLSTPSLGANVPITILANQGGPLLKHLKLLGTESARINAEFAKLRRRWKWMTYGVFAANETKTTKFLQYFYDIGESISELEAAPRYISIVPEASARTDMDGFGVIWGVDHFTICQSWDSFAYLRSFLTKIKEEEEQNAAQLQQSFDAHSQILDLDDRLGSVLTELQLEKAKPLGLALVGIDGIGKSTLAKQVVNATRRQFEYVCLVELETVDRSRRRRMLETLVAQNLQYSNGRRVIIDEGQQPWVHIRGKKILMVVDDVHSEDEISQLCRMDWCGEGSRLIITSNRQDWRRQFIVHQVPLLSEEASYKLLATYLDEVTLKSIPKKVISQVVDGCGGLPLVLEVIGKYLWDKKEVHIWLGALLRLQMADSLDGSAEENVVWKKLKVSFDSLGKLEKQILLDVATFDLYPTCKTQYDLEIFRSAWGAEGYEELIDVALINLQQRSFLSVVRDNDSESIVHVHGPSAAVQVVWIHKQMRAMAAWISGPAAMNLEDRRNIWELQNLAALLTYHDKVSKARTEVLSITIRTPRKTHVGAGPQLDTIRSLQWSSLGSLKVLRLLRISDLHMLGADKLKFSPKLALLHLENCTREPQKENWWLPWSRLSSWPLTNENIEELGALSVLIFENCSFVQLPQNFHMLRCLKILRIHHSGKLMGALPENIGLLPALKHLSLNVPLERLPNSLLEFGSLQSLVLSGKHVQAWPIPITVDPYCHLTALKELHLVYLPALRQLPDTFGGLASLEQLTIVRCSALEKLPEGFGALAELRTLDINYCAKLELLCESFSSLSQLRSLSLWSLPKLKMLPVTIGDLRQLRSLFLWSLPKLKMLPVTIGDLPSLEHLSVLDCTVIKELPGSFTNLPSMRRLDIRGCDALESVWPDIKYCHVDQGLENLESLHVLSCPKLRGLPKSLEQLKSLKDLDVRGCKELRYGLESLFQLTSLSRLDMNDLAMPVTRRRTASDDGKRESLESLEHGSSLCTLGANSQTSPAVLGLPRPLEQAEVQSFERTAGAFGSARQFPSLQRLGSGDYQYINSVPQSPAHQSSSTSWPVGECTRSAALRGSVGQLPNLRRLVLWNSEFRSTCKPQGMCLEILWLYHCRGVAHVLETMTICQWTDSLTNLHLVECQDLVSLPESIGQLMSLDTLWIENCSELTYLPESLGQLRNLRNLHIEDCGSTLTIPNAVYYMTWLEDLRIFGYRTFESKIVKSLKGFTRLGSLGLSTWDELICLQEFLSSVWPQELQLQIHHTMVKCMKCKDTGVAPEKNSRILESIDDSCGCIHTMGFLKWVEKFLSERGLLKIRVKKDGAARGYNFWSGGYRDERRTNYAYSVTVECGSLFQEFFWVL